MRPQKYKITGTTKMMERLADIPARKALRLSIGSICKESELLAKDGSKLLIIYGSLYHRQYVDIELIPQMKIVYIAHPISGDVKGNLEKIIAIVREINLTESAVVPLVPYYADCIALDDSIPEERERGIKNDIEIMKSGIIDELWLYGDRISGGMFDEIKLARSQDIEVVAKGRDILLPFAKLINDFYGNH